MGVLPSSNWVKTRAGCRETPQLREREQAGARFTDASRRIRPPDSELALPAAPGSSRNGHSTGCSNSLRTLPGAFAHVPRRISSCRRLRGSGPVDPRPSRQHHGFSAGDDRTWGSAVHPRKTRVPENACHFSEARQSSTSSEYFAGIRLTNQAVGIVLE